MTYRRLNQPLGGIDCWHAIDTSTNQRLVRGTLERLLDLQVTVSTQTILLKSDRLEEML